MAILKVESLRVGPGAMNVNTGESQIYAGITDPVDGPAAPYPVGKDGDIYLKVAGSSSTVFVKAGDVWRSVLPQPTTVALTDGQLVPAVAFQYPAGTYTYAEVSYTVRRGSGQGRKRSGVITILNDTVSNVDWSEESSETGVDVNVEFTYQISGGNVQILYTSAAEGVTIELKYSIKGWA